MYVCIIGLVSLSYLYKSRPCASLKSKLREPLKLTTTPITATTTSTA